MSDGDHYDVCCSCGTERLQRAMRQVTQSGLFMCLRCHDDHVAWAHGETLDDEPDAYEVDYKE